MTTDAYTVTAGIPCSVLSRRNSILAGLLILTLPYCLSANAQDDLEAAGKLIFQEVRERNRIMENLEFLSDIIGQRLTGRPSYSRR